MDQEDRVLAYLTDELDPVERRAFEADLAKDPSLRAEVLQWQQLAQARQLDHNELGLHEREAAFLKTIDSLAEVQGARTEERRVRDQSALQKAWKWLWPAPASPLLPMGWALAVVMTIVAINPLGDNDYPYGTPTRGGDAGCPRISIDLPDAVSAKQLRETLSQFAVTIVSGPDENGLFVLIAKRSSSLEGAARAIGATRIAPLPNSACPVP